MVNDIKLRITPEGDTSNSYPSEIEVEVREDSVTLILDDDRELTFDSEDFIMINKLITLQNKKASTHE